MENRRERRGGPLCPPAPRPSSYPQSTIHNHPVPHLHTHTWFSFLRGGSSPEALVRAAVEQGMRTLALTDRQGVYGVVRFQRACREAGIRPIVGAEVEVDGHVLVLLARNDRGYANLCRLLTALYGVESDQGEKGGKAGEMGLGRWRHWLGDLHCLTGTRESRLWQLVDEGRLHTAQAWLQELRMIFGERLSVELAHHGCPGDAHRIQKLVRLAHEAGVPTVATGDVLYAKAEDYRVYDLMTCVRHGITVFDPHPDRPRNAEAYLRSEAQLRQLIPYPEAFARAEAIADDCHVQLLAEHITPPGARLKPGESAQEKLVAMCRLALEERYPPQERPAAGKQLEHELAVIRPLELEDFFLVVHEIIGEARRRGIRCAGRGSAANSIVAYLLGITAVDPIAHKLLFERFLHGGRKGTPDIDVDFDSDRREEVIAWMEKRFGIEQTAMTATLVTYRLRSALRDVAKTLGWPIEVVNKLSKAVPHGSAARVRDCRVTLAQVLGPAAADSPLFETLLTMTEALDGCPRHLGLHSGGMILSRKPLHHFTPIQVSANGVKVVQFDKEDVEALGLVKFDVLGLRMLAALSEASEMVARHERPDLDLDALPLDDARTFNMIRAGKTIGVFQIESQGQLHLLALNQPETFNDLIAEIALFRPGPLQGGMVHPFVKRRRGEEKVVYDHPSLEPVLKDTYGVILFQEQVLEVAHRFAGMSLGEADAFRSLMSKFRDPGEMEAMRERFVSSAIRNGSDEATAQNIFEKVSKFVGYGFCRSHAAAFAKHVYQSAWMKTHHPAAYMAAMMEHRPGMYNLMTLEEEARRFGVQTLPPCIHRSGIRYDIERTAKGRLAIRKPLTSIKHLTEDDARRIANARLDGPFRSIQDFYERIVLDADTLRSLARSGALDAVAKGDSRSTLWQVGLLVRRAETRPVARRPEQASLFTPPAFSPLDLPELIALGDLERLSWDYESHSAARQHPMGLVRRKLSAMEIRPISTCYAFGQRIPVRGNGFKPIVTVAGLSVLRQRPPTAKGVMFLTLEDETGFVQCVVRPETLEHLDHVLRRSAVIVRGELHIAGNWRGLVVQNAWALDGIFGGYEGHPSMGGGLDTHVTRTEEEGVVNW
jgi:error-prone DNA polymerase